MPDARIIDGDWMYRIPPGVYEVAKGGLDMPGDGSDLKLLVDGMLLTVKGERIPDPPQYLTDALVAQRVHYPSVYDAGFVPTLPDFEVELVEQDVRAMWRALVMEGALAWRTEKAPQWIWSTQPKAADEPTRILIVSIPEGDESAEDR